MGDQKAGLVQEGKLFAERYLIRQVLSKGPVGKVYHAFDTLLGNEEIALRIVPYVFGRGSRRSSELPREMLLLRKLTHENLARVLDVGLVEQTLYLAMEYVESRSLESLLDEGPIDAHVASRIIVQVGEAISALHDAEVIHGNLKASNVLLTSAGELKVADFGFVDLAPTQLNLREQLVSDLNYVAPEVWQQQTIGQSYDFYALGSMSYFMLTGILPYAADSVEELREKQLSTEVVEPRNIVEEVPQWLNELVMLMLNKDPELRPQSADEIVERVKVHFTDGKGGAGIDLLAGSEVLVAAHVESQSNESAVPEEEDTLSGDRAAKIAEEAVESLRKKQRRASEESAVIIEPSERLAGSSAIKEVKVRAGTVQQVETPAASVETSPNKWAHLSKVPLVVFIGVFLGVILIFPLRAGIDFLWEAATETGELSMASLSSGILVLFIFYSLLCALPVFCLAWIHKPLKDAIVFGMKGGAFFAVIIAVLFCINSIRIFSYGYQHGGDVASGSYQQVLKRTTKYTGQNIFEIALLFPKGTSYEPEMGGYTAELVPLGPDESNLLSSIIYYSLWLAYLIFLAYCLWDLLQQSGLRIPNLRLFVPIFGILCIFQCLMEPMLHQYFVFRGIYLPRLDIGPFSFLFETYHFKMGLFNWLLILFLAVFVVPIKVEPIMPPKPSSFAKGY